MPSDPRFVGLLWWPACHPGRRGRDQTGAYGSEGAERAGACWPATRSTAGQGEGVSALVRVLLADDHTLVRAGIRALLTELPGVRVVAEAADGHEAVELARLQQPNLVLMDISMKGLNGIEATAQLKRELPDVRVIILSMHASEEHVAQALQAGAAGYMLKDAATQELALAVAAVM